MKKVLLGTLAVLTLAACSKDEVIQQNPNDEITFSVVTNKAVSRAENGFCNKHMPARFVVSASYTSNGTDFKQYFLNDRFKKETDNIYKAFDTYRYWPDLSGANTKLTFYAATDGPKVTVADSWEAPIFKLPSWKKDAEDNPIYTGMEIVDYEVNDEVAEQRDLLYAVQEVESNPASGGVQTINFRHALSQIEFAAKNENPNIYVEISGIQLVNVFKKGTYTFPTGSTNENYEGPETTENPDDNPHSGPATIEGGVIANHGTWAVATDTKKTYTIET